MNKDENFNEILQTSRLEPFTLVRDILVNWWVILLGALAAAMLAATVLSLRWQPAYTTSATFAVSSRVGASSYADLNSASEMAGTFQKILQSSALNKILCEELEVDSIDAAITSNVIPNTNLLELSVSSSSPREAFDTIHAVMDNYAQVSGDPAVSLQPAEHLPRHEAGLPGGGRGAGGAVRPAVLLPRHRQAGGRRGGEARHPQPGRAGV